MRNYFLIIAMFFGVSYTYGQRPPNDECLFATFIDDIDDYCSDGAEFTNVNATPDPTVSNSCFLDFQNGVWFSFIPREPDVLIQVLSGPRINGTMRNPVIALYSGCGDFLQCSPGKDADSDELTQTDLIIGQVYYVMIESPAGSEGTFELCINDFVAPKPPQSDCGAAVVLCDKSSFSIENLNSAGLDPNELEGSCLDNTQGADEFASSWYTWTCDESGTLTFDLIPNNNIANQITDDLDFVVYELPNGPTDCTDKIILRCMASGANQGSPLSDWAGCNGPTGLRSGDSDIVEEAGCQSGNDNYVGAIEMEAGRSYGLAINNFSRSGLGFSIDFGGTGTFLGPEPDFDLSAVQAFECDKTVIFENLSRSLADSIISYSWNFGVGASQTFADGPGPHDIVYESFGDKLAALTVETLRGCQVTKVLEFFVEPCCADTSTLDLVVDPIDITCGGDASGQLIGNGINGAPQYNFSLDGINFQPNPNFIGLTAGSYEVFIRDQKGCTNQTTVTLAEPEELRVFLGPDTIIELGQTIQLGATFTPPNSNITITWLNPDSLSCDNCLDPVSKTPGTTTYIIEIEDQNGCLAYDTITIGVEVVRPVYAPNIFSPNEDGNNDYFNLFGGPAVIGVEEMLIYDRWGNQVYEGQNIEINNPTIGWDGKFGGKELNPGVFTWVARVKFLDDEVLPFSGDITLIR